MGLGCPHRIKACFVITDGIIDVDISAYRIKLLVGKGQDGLQYSLIPFHVTIYERLSTQSNKRLHGFLTSETTQMRIA
jgi:hypothetical protein